MNNYKPEGIPTIVPYLYVKGIPEFLEFAQKGLGAEIVAKTADDNGVVFYATLKLDESAIFAQEAEETANTIPAALYFYVEDLEYAFNRALGAGAVSLAEPSEHYHGDRNAAVLDRWGNQWWLATRIEILTDEQVAQRRKRE